jgi:CheY-like chemotaxis protein
VLVVDDNRDAADSLGLLLQVLGAEVEVVHGGTEALEAMARFRPAVVLLDLGMPHMDGLEVARRVREDPQLRDATLVALTGWGQREDRRRTGEAGFDYHLVKPADLAALQDILTLAPAERADVPH